MTDSEELHRLLLEREQELEVAAKVGQLLLQRNELLEQDLTAALVLKDSLESTASQLRHEVAKKEDLLNLYVQDVSDQGLGGELEQGEYLPEWIQMLREESRLLRTNNSDLRTETECMRSQAESLEKKEQDLVQQCMRQLADSNTQLKHLQSDSSSLSFENKDLLEKLSTLSERIEHLQSNQHRLYADNETLKDKLSDAHVSHVHFTAEVTELSEKHEECSALWREAQEELASLRAQETALLEPGGDSNSTTGESLVCEIEDAIRKELQASDKGPAPASAYQPTKSLMETVQSTMQTQQKREKLIKELEDLLESSTSFDTSAVSRGDSPVPIEQPRASSPTLSEPFSLSSLGQELRRHRGPYFPPEKLKIVKPLEGSLTLLKWKLLATPHLGGATSFFSSASRPGIHVKGSSEQNSLNSTSSSNRDDSVLSVREGVLEPPPRESTPVSSPNQGLGELWGGSKIKKSVVHSPALKRGSPHPTSGTGLAALLDDFVD